MVGLLTRVANTHSVTCFCFLILSLSNLLFFLNNRPFRLTCCVPFILIICTYFRLHLHRSSVHMDHPRRLIMSSSSSVGHTVQAACTLYITKRTRVQINIYIYIKLYINVTYNYVLHQCEREKVRKITKVVKKMCELKAPKERTMHPEDIYMNLLYNVIYGVVDLFNRLFSLPTLDHAIAAIVMNPVSGCSPRFVRYYCTIFMFICTVSHDHSFLCEHKFVHIFPHKNLPHYAKTRE